METAMENHQEPTYSDAALRILAFLCSRAPTAALVSVLAGRAVVCPVIFFPFSPLVDRLAPWKYRQGNNG